MSLHLFFSNDPDTLASELWARAHAQWEKPLQPPILLIPNRFIDSWLKLRISRECGIILGLSGRFIEEFLWDLLVLGKTPETEQPALVGGELLQQILLHIMRKGGPADTHPEFAALRDYLNAGTEAGRTVRTVHMAGRISNLLLEYEYSRPDLYDAGGTKRFEGLLSAWPDSDYFAGGSEGARRLEKWQRALYGLVFGDGGALSSLVKRTGRAYTTLPRALAGLTPREVAKRAADNGLDTPVFVFGMSGLSLFHRQTLIALSQAVDVHVFTLNPCSAFWEDVETVRRRAKPHRAKGRPEGRPPALDEEQWRAFGSEAWKERCLVEPPEDNRLLQLWGHSGKENIALWCQAADYDFSDAYVEGTTDSLLGRIKRSLLYRYDRDEDRDTCPQDGSLIVFQAPGIRREVETARDFVLEALRTDRSLTPGDIGIFVTDPDAYRCALHEVWGSCQHDHPLFIPWHLADEGRGATHFCQAVRGLIGLAGSDASRTSVFEVLANPLIAAGCGAGATDIDTWRHWAVRLNVSHGLHAAHRGGLGEHAPSAQHTWQRGFERLISGHIAEIDLLMQSTECHDPEAVVRPYHDLESEDSRQCALFIRTVEALFRDLHLLGSGPDWQGAVEHLERIIAAWIRITPDYGDEEPVRTAYLEKLRVLSERDGLEGGIFDKEEFLRLAEQFADRGPPEKTASPTGKLMISGIRHSRALPFRIVYVLGMNQGRFPGSADRDTLDLRTWKYVPGDQRPLWRNQYAFLELITCARERLVLSYESVDIAKDEPLLPCSTLCELISFIDTAIMPTGQNFRPTEIRLLPEGEEGDGSGASVPWIPPTYSGEAAALAQPSIIQPVPEPAVQSGENSTTIDYTVDEMRCFLINPLEFTLRRGLGLRDEEGDGVDPDDTEPFASDGLAAWAVSKRFIDLVCDRTLDRIAAGSVGSDESEIQALFDQAYEFAQIDGRTPEGVFSDIDRDRILRSARELSQALIDESGAFVGWQTQPRAFIESRIEGVRRRYVELTLADGRCARIRGGPLRLLRSGDQCTIVEVTPSKMLKSVRKAMVIGRRSHVLKPMLFSLAYAVAHKERAPHLRFFALTGSAKGGSVPLSLDVDFPAARQYLCDLITDMEDTRRALDYLPFEAVEELWGRLPDDASARDLIEEWIEEKEQDAFRPSRPEIESLRTAPRNIPDDAASLVRRRFSVLFGAGGVQ